MFIGPSRLKFKKYHRKKLKFCRFEKSQFINKFGQLGIQACESRRLTSNQLEAVRRSIRRGLFDKKVQIKINTFPFFSRTKKPVSSRMGKGKGKHSHYESAVYTGKVLFELSKIGKTKKNHFLRVLQRSLKKLSLNTKLIKLRY